MLLQTEAFIGSPPNVRCPRPASQVRCTPRRPQMDGLISETCPPTALALPLNQRASAHPAGNSRTSVRAGTLQPGQVPTRPFDEHRADTTPTQCHLVGRGGGLRARCGALAIGACVGCADGRALRNSRCLSSCTGHRGGFHRSPFGGTSRRVSRGITADSPQPGAPSLSTETAWQAAS